LSKRVPGPVSGGQCVCELFDPVRYPDYTSVSGANSHDVPRLPVRQRTYKAAQK
jgi:hypothetical protein